jgi:hypothetical protein
LGSSGKAAQTMCNLRERAEAYNLNLEPSKTPHISAPFCAMRFLILFLGGRFQSQEPNIKN